MPYDVYLHRTFDYQLSPTPSADIDWAPERRMVRAAIGGLGAPAALWSNTQPNVGVWEEPLVSLEQRYRQILIHQQQQQQATGVALPGENAGEVHTPSLATSAGMTGPPAPTSADEVLNVYGGSSERARHAAITPEDDVFRLYQISASAAGAQPSAVPLGGTGAGPSAQAHGNGNMMAVANPALSGAPTTTPTVDTSAPGSPLMGGLGGVSGAEYHTAYASASGAGGQASLGPAGKYTVHAGSSSSPFNTSPLQGHAAGWAGAGSGPTGGSAGGVGGSLRSAIVLPSWWPGWMPGGWLLGTVPSAALPLGRGRVVPPLLLPPSPQTVAWDSIWHSYGRLPIYQSDSLIVSVALYAGVGYNKARVWELTPNATPKQAAGVPAPVTTTATGPNSDLANAVVAYLQHGNNNNAASTPLSANGGSRHRRSGPASPQPAAPGIAGLPGASTHNNYNNNNNNNNGVNGTPTAAVVVYHVPVHTAEDGTPVVEVGSISESRALRVLDVLQLEWYNPQRSWRGVFNLRMLPPTLHTRVPICEYTMQTPWTEWSLQSDELVIKWSGFVTLYQQRPAPSVAVPAAPTPATGPAPAPATAADTKASEKRGTAEAAAAAEVQPLDRKSAAALSDQKGAPSSAAPSVVANTKHNSNSNSNNNKSGSSSGATPRSQTESDAEVARKVDARQEASTAPSTVSHAVPASSPTPAPVEAPLPAMTRVPTVPWWRLRKLKVGAGVAVKNDLASGINLYWGLSGCTGKGLSFSGHVDVLRRMCCTCSSSLGAVDASVRLRLNLITFHQTGLDAGLVYYPLRHSRPNTAVRAACSNGKYTVGLQLHDVTHEWLTWRLPDAATSDQLNGTMRGGAAAAPLGTEAGVSSAGGVISPVEQSWWGAVKRTLHLGGAPASVDTASTASTASTSAKAGAAGTRAGTAGRGAQTLRSGASAGSAPGTSREAASTAANSSSEGSEGSWISAGWASATWGYITHHVGGLFGGGGGDTAGASHKGSSPATTGMSSSSSATPSRTNNNSSPSVSSSAGGRANSTVDAGRWQGRLHTSQAWVRGQAQSLTVGTRRAYQQVGSWTGAGWATVRGWQTRYVSVLLDSSRVDISMGITCDKRRPNAKSWSSFVMVSIH